MSTHVFENLVNFHHKVSNYGLVYTEAILRRRHGEIQSCKLKKTFMTQISHVHHSCYIGNRYLYFRLVLYASIYGFTDPTFPHLMVFIWAGKNFLFQLCPI